MSSDSKKVKPVVPIRHPNFHFDPALASKYCHMNNDFSSAFVLTFSSLIPHGERFVIDSVRAYREKIKDPELKARVNGLIGQEAMHSKMHSDFNAMYEAKGLPVNAIDRMGYWYFAKLLSGLLPLRWQLGVTCAIEHGTAIMAEKYFSEPVQFEYFDDGSRDFLAWHLLEELEHKSVAFDLYQEQVGSYWLRIATFLLFRISVAPLGFLSIRKIMKTPGYRQRGSAEKEGRRFWFGKNGFFGSVRAKELAYLRRDFHPNDIDTTQLSAGWGEYMLGDDGVLAPHINKTIIPNA
jgi:uncharacterized protein